jgi:hypothetical protein
MKKTHLSLYYLIGYLVPSGLCLLLIPQFTLKLLFSNADYGDIIPRLAGMLALALAVLVIQIVRLQIEALYTTILAVRGGMLLILLALFFYSQNPLFISLFVVVGIGFVLTGIGYYLDSQARLTSQKQS